MKRTDLDSRNGGSKGRIRRAQLWLLILFFAVPVTGGLLSFIQVLRDGQAGVAGLRGVIDVDLSLDGDQVYVAGQDDNSLVVFNRDDVTGDLTPVEQHEDGVGGVFGLLGASGVASSPDGRHVYATGEIDDTLVVFSRDATLDSLTFVAAEVQENNVGGVVGLDGAKAVAVSPDDTQVFVASRIDDALAVFSRSATADALSFVEAELDGTGGVEGLNGASAVAVSPDSRHVYVASESDSSVAIFTRNVLAGTVDYVGQVADDTGGVDGLGGATGVAVSPDGEHVYVAGKGDDALAAFERDFFSGELTFLAIYRDGFNGVDGLNGAADVVLNASGDRVIVAGRFDDAVAVFRRDTVTGALALLEVLKDGVSGVDGLAGAIAVAANDDHAYAAGYDEDAVAAFEIALCDGDDATGDSDGDAVCDDIDLCLGDDFLGDADADTVCNDLDACPGFDDLVDADGDLVPDYCDVCLGDDATGDSDLDGFCDDVDVCAGFSDSPDGDGDGVPDGCDLCDGDDATGDLDADAVCDDLDACPGFDDGSDTDGDGVPDGCDLCDGDDATGDLDGDAVCDDLDACPGFDDGSDADADGVPDGCDLCDGDDASGDGDGDGVCASLDCDDADAADTGICGFVFSDGFESGTVSAWSSSSP